ATRRGARSRSRSRSRSTPTGCSRCAPATATRGCSRWPPCACSAGSARTRWRRWPSASTPARATSRAEPTTRPTEGSVSIMSSDELLAEIMRLYEGLEELSYYEYLGLRPGCDYVAVRDGFYARAQRFHPDQFVYRGGESLRQAVYAVFKRMTEAYNVLLDPELRVLYDAAMVRGEARLSEV